MITVVIFFSVLFLAFANGANDNFKGVATLFGSGTLKFKQALSWATITTFAGSIVSIFLADKLLKNFSGKGLISDEMLLNPSFAASVAVSAGLTVFVASKIGMPISTTHALTGSLAGAGIMSAGTAFNFMKLGSKFFFPLLVSPLMALLFTYLLYLFFKKLRPTKQLEQNSCLCIQSQELDSKKNNGDVLVQNSLIVHDKINLKLDTISNCELTNNNVSQIGISTKGLMTNLHYLSAGVVSFSRGLNDTPKIAGILLLISATTETVSLPIISLILAITMAIGGLINSKRVAYTMSKKITAMNDDQGFTANLATAILVSTASIHGMPVSTTHVSVGSILGIGIANKKGNWKVIKEILLSWVLTLPIAAVLAMLFFLLFNQIL